MACTTSIPQFPSRRLASHTRCKSPLSRCRRIKNHQRSYNRNQQYSITAITDGSGAIVERYAYSAYGTPTITDASGTLRTTTAIGNRYTYTGREYDEMLALYHYRARMFDSVGGRFVSRDPIGFEGSKWNLFEYVNSKPLRSTDALGLAGDCHKNFDVCVEAAREGKEACRSAGVDPMDCTIGHAIAYVGCVAGRAHCIRKIIGPRFKFKCMPFFVPTYWFPENPNIA
jgi:RHS repeat-associated protein